MKNVEFHQTLEELEQKFANMLPELELTVRDPELGVEGYVVVWNTAISKNGPLSGCGKGGTRITPTLSLEEVKMLARTMALKNAAAGLPLGGAKSGIRADSTAPDFESKYRRFVSLVKPNLYEHGGIFGGFGFDIGGRPEHALWACDQLQSTRSFTGKPVELGGTDYDRVGIAGLGVAVAAQAVAQFQARDCSQQTFAVQGLGAMGSAIVRYFSESGANLKAVSDLRLGGSFILEEPASAEILLLLVEQQFDLLIPKLKAAGRFIADVNAVLEAEVDIVFPAATQAVITVENVSKIKAKLIVEGANNPTSDELRMELDRRGVLVIPDFIANPGGIIAAFVELTSQVSVEENIKSRAKVNEAINYTRKKIAENVLELLKLVNDNKVSPLHAARFLALSRMFAI
jgi:glutamate dehydrogenase (NAD(P)+)